MFVKIDINRFNLIMKTNQNLSEYVVRVADQENIKNGSYMII